MSLKNNTNIDKDPRDITYFPINDKYYNFGTYLNIWDDIKNIIPQCCNGGGGGGDCYFIENYINGLIIKDDKWKVKLSCDHNVTSNVTIRVDYTYVNNFNDVITTSHTITMNKGIKEIVNILPIPNDSLDVIIKSLFITPPFDDNYVYVHNMIENKEKVYFGVIPNSLNKNITPKIIKNMNSFTVNLGANPLQFIIDPSPIVGLNDIPNESDFQNTIRDNAFDLIIAISDRIKDFEITDILNLKDDNFTFLQNLEVNNLNYKIFIRDNDDTQNNVYDSLDAVPSELIINYNIDIRKYE